MVKKVSYASPSDFNHFAGHLQGLYYTINGCEFYLFAVTIEMVERTCANIGYFLQYVDPDKIKMTRKLKGLHSQIL